MKFIVFCRKYKVNSRREEFKIVQIEKTSWWEFFFLKKTAVLQRKLSEKNLILANRIRKEMG